MKVFIQVVLFFLLPMSAYTQITWQKLIGGSENDEVYDFEVLDDGGLIIVGSSNSFGSGDNDFYLVRTNNSGDVIWSKTYGWIDEDHGRSVALTDDGGFIICGGTNNFNSGENRTYLIKTDSAGDTLWTKKLVAHSWGNDVQQTLDGGYIIAGSIGGVQDEKFLIKTNEDGDTSWTRTLNSIHSNASGFADKVQLTVDSGFIVIGKEYNGSDVSAALLIKLNSLGDTLWTSTYVGKKFAKFNDVKVLDDNSFILTGGTWTGFFDSELFIMKTDSNGDTIQVNGGWIKKYGSIPGDSHGNTIVEVENGNFAVAGVTDNGMSSLNGIWLFKTNSEGDSLWSRFYDGGSSVANGGFVRPSEDKGLYLAGTVKNDIIIIKTDSTGYADSLILSVPDQNNVNNLNFQPNPFYITTTIKLPKSITDNLQFFLYNLSCNMVESFPITSSCVQLHRKNLPAGIYLYQIKHLNSTLTTGKLVIQ